MTKNRKRKVFERGDSRRFEGVYAYRLCGDLNPDIRVFYILAFARVVALAGFCLRTFTAMQRDELYTHSFLGVRYIVLAPTLAVGYFVWLYGSTWPHVRRLSESKRAVTDSIFNGKKIVTQSWVGTVIVLDLVFFSGFFLTTLKVESDLFMYFTVPIFTASAYFESSTKRRLATVCTCLALTAAIFLNFQVTHGALDSRPDEFASAHGLRRVVVNVLAIRVMALWGVSFVTARLVASFRASSDMLAAVLECIPVALWRKRKDGVFIYVNRKLTSLLDQGFEDIIGRTDVDLFGPVHSKPYIEGDRIVLSRGKPYTNPMESFPLPDGSTQMNYVVKVPLFDKRGEVVGTQGFFLDGATAFQQLPPDAELLGAVASYAGRLSHEVKNQMATIDRCAQFAEETFHELQKKQTIEGGEEVVEQCGVIRKIVGDLTSRLVDLGRLQKDVVKPERVRLAKLVKEELQRLEAHTHPYEVRFLWSSEVIECMGDPAYLCDAVRNLVINAREGIHRYAQLNPKAQIVFEVVLREDRGMASILVTNSGEIPDTHLRALQLGKRGSLKQDADAHGLGLPQVRTCAKLHRGHFNISRSTQYENCIAACLEVPCSF